MAVTDCLYIIYLSPLLWDLLSVVKSLNVKHRDVTKAHNPIWKMFLAKLDGELTANKWSWCQLRAVNENFHTLFDSAQLSSYLLLYVAPRVRSCIGILSKCAGLCDLRLPITPFLFTSAEVSLLCNNSTRAGLILLTQLLHLVYFQFIPLWCTAGVRWCYFSASLMWEFVAGDSSWFTVEQGTLSSFRSDIL